MDHGRTSVITQDDGLGQLREPRKLGGGYDCGEHPAYRGDTSEPVQDIHAMSPVRAGQLREEITYQSFTDVANGSGGFNRTVVDGDTVCARVRRKVVRKISEGGKLESAIEYDVDVRQPAPVDVLKGRIKFVDVSFAYDEGKKVLQNISFEAAPGSVTALVGSSGSGKTTIAGLTSSYFEPDRGLIEIDGFDLSQITLDSYRSQLAVVLQDDFLFDGTIRENIMFPRPHSTEEQLQAAIKAAHVKEFTDRFDEGLDTVIGERGVKLSGGQRQRVAIARAVLADPRILILDEATSNLDTESEAFIQESLNRLMKGRTTLVIAHRVLVTEVFSSGTIE